jgi:hypothetical protein
MNITKYRTDEFDGRNSLEAIVRICADARKEDCPYCIPIHIDNEHITFDQYFCGYKNRKGDKIINETVT